VCDIQTIHCLYTLVRHGFARQSAQKAHEWVVLEHVACEGASDKRLHTVVFEKIRTMPASALPAGSRSIRPMPPAVPAGVELRLDRFAAGAGPDGGADRAAGFLNELQRAGFVRRVTDPDLRRADEKNELDLSALKYARFC
jgi:hypothetical protein